MNFHLLSASDITGEIVPLIIPFVLLLAALGLSAVLYLQLTKLKAENKKILDEKNREIAALKAQLDKARKALPSSPPVLKESDILANIDAALEAGEFKFYLQPEVDQFTRKIMGAEALARWVRPGKGVYAPGTFIPALEKNGLISKLDLYIFEQVCKFQGGRLEKHLPTVPVSVNLSKADLEVPDILRYLSSTLKTCKVPANLVPIEIAASSFADNIELLGAVVEALRERNFYVGIDNLGKNQLSLDILEDIPTDSLKLDINSIYDGKNDEESKRLVSSVLRMGHTGKNILVGGVETEEQAEHLKLIGFRNAQGFLYHKPIPTDEFELLITPHKVKK